MREAFSKESASFLLVNLKIVKFSGCLNQMLY